MTSKLISTHTTKKCMRCGEPLKSFIAYIPNLGEACMRCYVEYAINDEKTLIH
jgi:NMD protein affecting ribosome stability and mRNA decay